jgi:hypothetical protein
LFRELLTVGGGCTVKVAVVGGSIGIYVGGTL